MAISGTQPPYLQHPYLKLPEKFKISTEIGNQGKPKGRSQI